MKIKLLLVTLVILTLQSCQSDTREGGVQDENTEAPAQQETPTKLIEYLVGEWQLNDSGGGTSQQGNNNGQRIRFTEEARYITYSGEQMVDSGAYRMNEQLRNLYLESEANEQPREFEIDLQPNVMTLKPRTPAQGEDNAPLTYRRVGNSNQ